MADSWAEYFYGTPEQHAADQIARQRQWEETTASPAYRRLRAMGDNPIVTKDRVFDPRAIRMQMVRSSLMPNPETDYSKDAVSVPSNAYSAVFESTMRPRDTLIRAGQEVAGDNYWKAAELLARAPLSLVYPPAAAGTPGSPDDWREGARKLGISEANIAAIDIGTDPETYLPIPIPLMAAGRAGRAAGRMVNSARYGRGVPTFLIDNSGNEIRRLLNSPVAPRAPSPLRVEYVR